LIDVALQSLIKWADDVTWDVVLVVDNDVSLDYVEVWNERLGERITVVEASPPFNFSDKVNRGAAAAGGEYVAFLNDDVELVGPQTLSNMVALASESDVGAVGALLSYPDGTIQHAGHFFANGVRLLGRDHPAAMTYRERDRCDRDVTGITAACLVQRRAVWAELGGLDVALPVNFNDVEYCSRLGSAGYRIVQCNSAQLRHAESQTRTGATHQWEVDLLRSRIGEKQLMGPDALSPSPTEIPAETRSRWQRWVARLTAARR